MATSGPVSPVGEIWRRLETLIRRGLLQPGPCTWNAAEVTLTLTPFGSCALAAYRAAEAAGLLREVA